MKNLIYVFISVLLCVTVKSQVGINTKSPKALMDIKVSDPDNPAVSDGLLLPRVNTLNYTPGADQDKMMVFLEQDEAFENTDASGNNITCTRYSGLYYWNNSNSKWLPITTQLDTIDSGLVLYRNDCDYLAVADAVAGVMTSSVLFDTNSSWKQFILGNEVIDNYNLYDPATGVFTCRESGTYRIAITLDISATIVNGNGSLIFGLVKIADGGSPTNGPSVNGNKYVTRNTAVFSTSTPDYGEPFTISTYAELEEGAEYTFGGLSFHMNTGESIRVNYINSGGTGFGYSTTFAINRIK